jgi:hypothetical protein
VNPQPTYLPKPFPVIDDGKWYILESKKTGKVFGNYLQPVKSGVDVVLGVDVFIPSDSIYWTLESNASGKVLIRNKALGYIDFDVLANNVLKFKQTKPIAGMTMTPFGTVDQSISFFGDTTGILKGLCPTDLANSFKIGYNSFSLTNDITRFDFNEKSFHSLFSLQKSYAGMVNVGNGIGCTSQIEKDKFSTAMSLIYNNYMQIANPTQAQTDVAIRSICDARVTFMNSIKQPQTSTAAIPVWYRIKTNWMYWQIYKQFYLYTTGTGLLNTANVTTADNFMFRFENIGNGKVRIIPKNYPTQALRAGVLYASYTFSIAPFDQYTEFNLIDYPGANGVMKLIVGNTINATYPSYMHYPTTFPDITTAQVLNNYLVADLRMYLTNDWTMNSFEIEEVVPTFTATESVIAEHSIIRVVDGRVLVDGTDKIDIYNIYGVKMPLKQRLATGVYIVVVANQAQKIIVR